MVGKTVNYSVRFWGIHSADISATYIDTIFQEQLAVKIHFITHTTSLASQFFFVENSYTTIINSNNHKLLFFTKNTNQPNLTNTISTFDKNDILYYSNNNNLVNIDSPNIFTLLYLLQSGNTTNVLNQSFIIEREGLLYSASIIIDEFNDINIYDINLSLNENLDNSPVYENTDIFTWAVFKPEAKRFITVNKNDNTITKCEFTFNLIRMIAEVTSVE